MSDENGGFIESGRRRKDEMSGFVYLVAFDFINYYFN